MVSLFLLLGCNLSYIVDLLAALHQLASASARTLLKLASSVRTLVKPYGDTLSLIIFPRNPGGRRGGLLSWKSRQEGRGSCALGNPGDRGG